MSVADALNHPWLVSYRASKDRALVQVGRESGGNSRGAPLQRRSYVLSEAAETGRVLPEPSWEMIAYANNVQDSQNGGARGAGKRLRGELSPHVEEPNEEEMESGGGMSSSSGDGNGNGNGDGGVRRSTRRKVARRR